MKATHTISPSMKKERAALYKVPASVKNAVFGKLDSGTLVQVTREWVNGKWDEIRVVDPAQPAFQKSGIKDRFFFVKHRDLTPLTFEAVGKYDIDIHVPKVMKKVIVKPQPMSKIEKIAIPDWASNTGAPFYHQADMEYWVSVKLPNVTSCVTQQMEQVMMEAKLIAVETLFDYYNVKYNTDTKEEVNEFANGFLSCYAHDYHLDDRPGSKLRVLVKVRAIYFDWLRQNGDPLRSNKMEDLPEVARVITLDPEKYEQEMDKMAKMMAKLSLDMQREDVFVPGVNLMKESRRLKQFVPRLRGFIKANGFDPSNSYGRKYLIEVGMDEEYNVKYVVLKFDKSNKKRHT